MTEASLKDVAEWIVTLIEAGEDDTTTLRNCMEYGEIPVLDESGKKHRLGDKAYEDAYLAALRQLVKADKIEPVFEEWEDTLAWRKLERTRSGETKRSVLDVPLRAVPEQVEDGRTPRRRAQDYLLKLLLPEGKVRYRIFYDGTEATEKRLCREFGLDHDADSEAVLMDEVAWSLSEKGVVKITELTDKLSDGEQDYLIELTPPGRKLLEESKRT